MLSVSFQIHQVDTVTLLDLRHAEQLLSVAGHALHLTDPLLQQASEVLETQKIEITSDGDTIF